MICFGHESEFARLALDAWAHTSGVKLDASYVADLFSLSLHIVFSAIEADNCYF